MNVSRVKLGGYFWLWLAGIWMVTVGCTFGKTFTVTNSDSVAIGSFYWAITESQGSSGPDTILFNISRHDPQFTGTIWRIFLSRRVPIIKDGALLIDGFSQGKNKGDTNPAGPEVEIRGDFYPSKAPFLQIESERNIIRGIALGNFKSYGIQLSGVNARNNRVQGCYIGVDAAGERTLTNLYSGILIEKGAESNLIGGLAPVDRNVISGNQNYGIQIEASHRNEIFGNFVGIDATGLVALGNGTSFAGIGLDKGARKNRIGSGTVAGRNILSGNGRPGLWLRGAGTDSNLVQGNYFGLGADGETKIANGEAGMMIGPGGVAYNLIGGDEPEQANVISGNKSSGLQFRWNSHHNVVKGNLIGTNAAGDKVVPNFHNGIYLFSDPNNGTPTENIIGPNNIICGNGDDTRNIYWAGISVGSIESPEPATHHNWFHGNFIGMHPKTGLQAGQNFGVLIQAGAHNNLIGPDNLIVNCKYNGVHVMHPKTVNNKVTQNLIYNIQRSVIENVDGGNKELAPPDITFSDQAKVAGKTQPNLTVEVFFDSSGHEARTFLGTTVSNADGLFEWHGVIPEGGAVSATATDADGNTSELSRSNPTPVELVTFRAVLKSNIVQLSWITASETNNFGFWLERSKPGEAFIPIGFIPGHGTSGQSHYYSYCDTLKAIKKVNYRLKQVDTDGGSSFSEELFIEVQNAPRTTKLAAFPNPFNAVVKITITAAQSGLGVVEIYDVLGRRIRSLKQGHFEAGWHDMAWDGQNDLGETVATGIYLIRFSQATNHLVHRVLLLR